MYVKAFLYLLPIITHMAFVNLRVSLFTVSHYEGKWININFKPKAVYSLIKSGANSLKLWRMGTWWILISILGRRPKTVDSRSGRWVKQNTIKSCINRWNGGCTRSVQGCPIVYYKSAIRLNTPLQLVLSSREKSTASDTP